MDYRWMTKVAIHIMDNVNDFITQYQIPSEDINEVKNLWGQALEDWKNFKTYAKTNIKSKPVIPVSEVPQIQAQKVATIKIENTEKEEELKRCRNAKILNRLHQFNFQEEEEEDLINKYIDELNYQKAKKLSDLISFYGEEEEELNISPNLSIA